MVPLKPLVPNELNGTLFRVRVAPGLRVNCDVTFSEPDVVRMTVAELPVGSTSEGMLTVAAPTLRVTVVPTAAMAQTHTRAKDHITIKSSGSTQLVTYCNWGWG